MLHMAPADVYVCGAGGVRRFCKKTKTEKTAGINPLFLYPSERKRSGQTFFARLSFKKAASPYPLNPLGCLDCHRQLSAHISSMPRVASQPSSRFALDGSA